MRGPHARHSILPLLLLPLLLLLLTSSVTAATTTTTAFRPLQQRLAAWCLPSRQLLHPSPGFHTRSFSTFSRTMPAPTRRRPSVAVHVRKGEEGREDYALPVEGAV